MEEAKHFIGGEWTASSGGDTIPVVDPSDGQPFTTLARGTAADIDHAVQCARRAYEGAWGAVSAAERGRLLYRLSMLVTACHEELAQLEARDTGKPLKQARGDAAALARYFEFYAGAADKLHGETLPYQNGYTVFTIREPHGVTGHIVPWNYPMQIFGRSVGAALATGNACVVKPAEDACLSVLRVAELAAEAGLPAGALNIVTGYGHEAGAALARHAGIDHISFTGSPETGKLVTQMASENHVPVTLELGGKSPNIIFEDADLKRAIPGAVAGVFAAAGQTCIAGSRLIVHRTVYEEVLEGLVEWADRIRLGNPKDETTDMGPVANPRQYEGILGMIRRAEESDARLITGGSKASEELDGLFIAPTIFADVDPQCELAQEEVFGPVLSVFPFDTDEEAIALANSTRFGLASGMWTQNLTRVHTLGPRLRAGTVWVNTYRANAAQAPFGGVGESGYGRERGLEALEDYLRVKNTMIDLSNEARDPFQVRT